MIEHTDHVTCLPLEEELLDVREYQGVSIEEWATHLFDKKVNHCSARTLACVSYVNSVGSSVPQKDILACKSKGSVHIPLGLCGVTAEHGGRGFRADQIGLSAARMAKFGGIGAGAHGDRRRRSYCFSVGSLKPAIIVETAVGPLLTISGRCPGEVAVGLGIEFPDYLRPEPVTRR